MAEVTSFMGIAFGFCQLLPSHNPLPSNLHVIHGDECGSPRPDLQPDLSEEWAHLQPASPAVDFHLWLCCKYERLKFVHDPKYLLRAGTAGRIDTDWRSRICPLYSVQVRDYSGTYTVKLIPCTTAQNMEYTVPPVCSPREPVTFDLDIRFQQVRHYFSFTLGSTIFLCCQTIFSLSLWLALSLSVVMLYFMMRPSVGERPGCSGVQSEHSDVLAVQEELMALWWLHGFRSGEWCSLFWRCALFLDLKTCIVCAKKKRLYLLL